MRVLDFYRARHNAETSVLSTFLIHYFLLPLRSGIGGFIAFFVVLAVSKLLGYFTGSIKTWNIESSDILLSLLGFILLFLIKFLENFKQGDD